MQETVEQPATPDSAPASSGTPETDIDNEGAELLAQETEPEEIEEELEGIKLRGKKEALERIKAERLMHADYTRKTQEVAEQRRTFEAQQKQFQERAQLHQQHIRAAGELVAVEQRLSQFQNVNWAALNAENPQQAQALHIEFTQLQTRYGQLGNYLAQQEQARKLETERTSATRANESEQIVMREVKDWGPEKLKAFVSAGEKAGLPAESMRQALIQFPQISRFLNKALMYDQLLASRLQKPAAEPQKPVTRLGGGAATHTKALSEVTDPREWQRLREQRKSRNR